MWTRARDLASIRTRLILLPAIVLCAGMPAEIVVTLLAARNRIDAETEGAEKPSPEVNSAPWPQSFPAPERIVARYPVSVRGTPHGTLAVAICPADEAAEIWSSLVFLVALLGTVSAAIAIAILVTARQTLKPLGDLVEGLRRLRQGRFDALGEIRVADPLARTRADNRLLVDRLMAIEERAQAPRPSPCYERPRGRHADCGDPSARAGCSGGGASSRSGAADAMRRGGNDHELRQDHADPAC